MEIKQYIVEEADKLFCQYGFKSVTMDDIAKKLGMSKKTIYQHFVDKDEMVNILIREKLESQNCVMDDMTTRSENAVHELLHAITNMNALLSTINAKLFYDLQKYHPTAWIYFKNFRERSVQEMVSKNLKRGVEEGFFRQEINPEILTRMRLEQIDIIFGSNEAYEFKKYTLSKIMTELTEHFLYGVCNEKGLKEIERYKKLQEQN